MMVMIEQFSFLRNVNIKCDDVINGGSRAC